jgi:asparagine synthase (glutamine-hydrolysing)
MCGLAGFCDFTRFSDKELLQNMIETLNHRGPDGTGEKLWHFDSYNIGFAHKRLSIIDLSASANQPLFSEDNNIAVVFNGEIYNYKEIRNELVSFGYNFLTNSDTEVIVKAYQNWGLECVHQFIGMFAIVIFDLEKEHIYIIRDRAGVKPLFYYYSNGVFLFASELKAFHKHPKFQKKINTSALSGYLKRGWISNPLTIFENTFKLLPGHILDLNLKDKSICLEKYWDVIDLYNRDKLQLSPSEIIEETENILESAFNYRMVSDVPVGVFLSGGFDSTTLAAILQKSRTEKIKTYTIGFYDKELDEAKNAKRIAKHLGTDHNEYYIDIDDALPLLDRLSYFYDEPFGDNSGIPTMLVSKIASEHVKVVLSADGGDEIFGGYPKYYLNNNVYESIRRMPSGIKKLLSLINALIPSPQYTSRKFATLLNSESNYSIYKDKIEQTHFENFEINRLLKLGSQVNCSVYDQFSLVDFRNDPINAMMCIDYKAFMCDDVLQKVDRASMSYSIESREPYLDQRIIEFLSQISGTTKISGNSTKNILRQIAYKYIPKDMLEGPKKGFAIPLKTWLNTNLKEQVYSELLDSNTDYLFNRDYIMEILDGFYAKKLPYENKIWNLLQFKLWYKHWMN